MLSYYNSFWDQIFHYIISYRSSKNMRFHVIYTFIFNFLLFKIITIFNISIYWTTDIRDTIKLCLLWHKNIWICICIALYLYIIFWIKIRGIVNFYINPFVYIHERHIIPVYRCLLLIIEDNASTIRHPYLQNWWQIGTKSLSKFNDTIV